MKKQLRELDRKCGEQRELLSYRRWNPTAQASALAKYQKLDAKRLALRLKMKAAHPTFLNRVQ